MENPVKHKTLKSLKSICLIPFATFCFTLAAQAQSPPAPATMPHGQTQKSMMGMDGMNKMTMSGDIDKDFAMMMKIHHQ